MPNRKQVFRLTLLGLIFILVLLSALFYFSNQVAAYLFLKQHWQTPAMYVLKTLGQETDYYNHFLQGRIFFVQGNLDQAINSFSRGIELNPDFAKSYYGRGLAYGFYQDRFLIQAENDFKKYLQTENKQATGYWAGYNDLAWIYFLKGEFELQEKVSREGLQIAESNAWLQNMLGVSLLAQKKCSEATPHLQMALELTEAKNVNKFGEAYSGDDPSNWAQGKTEMEKIIGDNLVLCKQDK